MKTETQASPELARLCELIEGVSVAMLTNVDAQGALVSRPMSPLEMDGDGALWFFTDLRSSKVEHLRVINLSFSDPQHAVYVSLSGRGEIDTDRAHIQRLWTASVRPWFPDGPDSAHLGLLKVVPDTAEYWDAPDSKMVRMFALAASVVAGKPLGQGEHDSFSELSSHAPATGSG